MIKALLINQEQIPHYRVGVYNHLSDYLKRENCALTVVSEGAQEGHADPIRFQHAQMPLRFFGLARLIRDLEPDVIIYWVRLRYPYLFPLLVYAKLLRKKIIYWGHGSDLGKQGSMWLKRFANALEYLVSDALILYGEHQKRHVSRRFRNKIFIANNTLCFDGYTASGDDRAARLAKHGITTAKNIICMGRMQRRKRLEDLVAAFHLLNRPDVGLVLAGPDTDGILQTIQGENIYKVGPVYGYARLDLLSACEVTCLPGAVGLSIVDAFYCGLPLVTEAGDESPEIMYLKDGVNGFVVPRGDVLALADKLRLLLQDDELRGRFAQAAKHEINTNGHIDQMCRGFSDAIRVARRGPRPQNVLQRAYDC
jgi:glycosyltransferase involved in cell wall biosynthesis